MKNNLKGINVNTFSSKNNLFKYRILNSIVGHDINLEIKCLKYYILILKLCL